MTKLKERTEREQHTENIENIQMRIEEKKVPHAFVAGCQGFLTYPGLVLAADKMITNCMYSIILLGMGKVGLLCAASLLLTQSQNTIAHTANFQHITQYSTNRNPAQLEHRTTNITFTDTDIPSNNTPNTPQPCYRHSKKNLAKARCCISSRNNDGAKYDTF